MPKKVIKKDGSEEEYDRDKVVASTMKAGAPAQDAHEIADAVESIPKEELHSSDIRRKVLDEFKHRNPLWRRRWYDYDKNVKRLHKGHRI